METATLLIDCPDTKGIVAQISDLVFRHDANIIRSDQYSTNPIDGRFFMRLEFYFDPKKTPKTTFEKEWITLAKKLQATWVIHYASDKMSAVILVSTLDHCLLDLLYHWRCGDLNMEIPFIISNHKECESIAKNYGITFHYLPLTPESKSQQEQQILKLVKNKSDFLILARYMQILSKDFLESHQNDIINIHHSFLPSFAGANPYQQAHDRGVKIIGATAHYVTTDLDEGPIIDQMVERVSHRDTPASLKRKGKNLEKLTLTKAVEAYIEHRVICYGNKTIVFD